MRALILVGIVGILFGCKPSIYLQKESVRLSNPEFSAEQIFFEGNTSVHISPTMDDAQIRYAINDGEVGVYTKPIVLNQSAKISALAEGGGYESSDSITMEVLHLPKSEIISILSERELNEKYGNGGLDILIDRKKGDLDYNVGWLGYVGGSITFDLNFDVVDVDYVMISTLRNQRAWIFSPQMVNIYLDGILAESHTINDAMVEMKDSHVFTKVELPNVSRRQLSIEIIALNSIPDWHPGKGSKPWVFIDEILIY